MCIIYILNLSIYIHRIHEHTTTKILFRLYNVINLNYKYCVYNKILYIKRVWGLKYIPNKHDAAADVLRVQPRAIELVPFYSAVADVFQYLLDRVEGRR